MTSLLNKLKTLWLSAMRSGSDDIRFSRGLTIRSHKIDRNTRPVLRLVKTTGSSN